MGYNLLIEEFIPEPPYALDYNALPYLAGGFFPFQTRNVNRFKSGKLHPLPGIALCIHVCQIVFSGIQRLLVGGNGALADF
jgi:hypothetical protein